MLGGCGCSKAWAKAFRLIHLSACNPGAVGEKDQSRCSEDELGQRRLKWSQRDRGREHRIKSRDNGKEKWLRESKDEEMF